MSIAEFERFNADLAADADMRTAAQAAASGLASLVAFATERGYSVTLDDATAFIKARTSQVMSNEEMDAIAGGGNAEMNVKDVSYALVSANGGCSIYAEVVSAVAGVVVLI